MLNPVPMLVSGSLMYEKVLCMSNNNVYKCSCFIMQNTDCKFLQAEKEKKEKIHVLDSSPLWFDKMISKW